MTKYFALAIFLFTLIPLNLNAQEFTPEIKVFDFQGNPKSTITLKGFDWHRTGDFAVIDLGNDQIPEIIIAAPTGEKPLLKFYRLDGSLISELLVYPESYLGGVNFEIADLDNDGNKEIITAATSTGGPHVRIIKPDGKELNSFFAFDKKDTGGINVAIVNFNNNSDLEIVVSSNFTEQIRIFNRQGDLISEFVAENDFKNGQKIFAADLGADGLAEILTFANKNDQPKLNLYQNDGHKIDSFLLFPATFKGGLNVIVSDKKILAGAGVGGGPHLKIINAHNNLEKQFFTGEQMRFFKLHILIAHHLINQSETRGVCPVFFY